MSSSDQRPPETTGAPAVGNILGFSLLFRDRKALLALPRRGLAPGVRLRDYEAEIPGVRFPLRGPLTAAKFRLRRCRALQATLSVEQRAVMPWLRERLVGVEHHGFSITDVELELRARFPGVEGGRPLFALHGVGRDGARASLLYGLAPVPSRGRLAMLVTHRWVFGEPSLDSEGVWRAALARLGPEVSATELAGRLVPILDPARLALTGPFVSAGWKAPDTTGLGLEAVSVSRRGVELALREGPDAPSPDEGLDDEIGESLEAVRQGLREGAALGDLLAALERIGDALAGIPAAQLACVRWRAELARYRDPRASLGALREWLELQPSAATPRRRLAVALARAGELTELAQLLAADCRLTHPPRTQARLELALATLLGERLEDPRTALAIAGPLVARLREEEALADLLPSALVTLAASRAAEASLAGRRAPHALEALDEALERTDAPRRRADHRARVAAAFARHGAPAAALTLLGRAIEEAPGDVELLDDAIELALEIGERPTAVHLLRLRLEQSAASDQAPLRRRLIAVLIDLDEPGTTQLALAEVHLALELDPDSPALLRAAADLEQRAGHALAAAEQLARLADLVEDELERAQLDLERARLLAARDQRDDAWDALRPWLPSAGVEGPLGEAGLEALELAVHLAPPTDRPRLLDRLVQLASGPRRGRALLERAAQAISVDARLADLRAALDEIDDPGAALGQLEPLLGDQDPDALLDLADWAQLRDLPELEARCRGRAGATLVEHGEHARALPQLARALELEPRREPLHLAIAKALEALDRPEEALQHLRPLLDPQRARRTGAPRATIAVEAARLMSALGEDRDAVQAYRIALEEPLPRDAAGGEDVAGELFTALYRLGRHNEAIELARARAREGQDSLRATWLARAAGISDSETRLQLLGEAGRLAPSDPEIAEALEAALRESGRLEQLEALLRERLETEADPERRVALLERLLASSNGRRPDAERLELYEELARVEPDHPEALLALATADLAAGRRQAALERHRRALAVLDEQDERAFDPCLALAGDAVDAGEHDAARAHLTRALRVRPDDPAALELMRAVALELDEPLLTVQVTTRLVASGGAGTRLPELELELARAHARLDEASLALAALERAAGQVGPGTALHLEIAETWLELARRWGLRPAEAAARAELRRALGPDLPLEELREEIRLLGDELDRTDEALLLAEDGLAGHAADPVLVALVARHASGGGAHRGRALEVLRNVLDRVAPGEPRDRVAWALISAARAQEEAALALVGLDRLSPDAAVLDHAIAQRRWAIRQLGRHEEERAAVEAALVASDGPPSRAMLQRLAATFDDDPAATAGQLLEIAGRVDLARACELAGMALDLAPRPWVPRQALAALRILARQASLPRAQLLAMAEDVLEGGEPERAAELVELAERASQITSELEGSADDLLDLALARFPEAPSLHQILVRRAAPASDEAALALARRVEDTARRHGMASPRRAAMLVSLAAELDEPLGSTLLLARARDAHEPGMRALLESALWDWGAWSALLQLWEGDPEPRAPGAWEELAEAAMGACDFETEAAARGHQGLGLLAEGDDEAAAAALERALDLQPDRPELRYALGNALARLGRSEAALQQLVPLVDEGADGWVRAGADLVELCRRCAGLLLDRGAADRAATLLARARRESAEAPLARAEITEELHRALLHAGRHDEAWRLASLAADEATNEHRRLAWLRRAIEQSPPLERAALLERALGLAPEDDALADRFEDTLGELGDEARLEALLRRRLARALAGELVDEGARAQTGARLDRLLALCVERQASADDLAELWRQRLSLDPDHPGALLALGGLAHARGDLETAGTLWRRADAVLPEDDERLLEPARTMLRWRLESRDPEGAATWVRRALVLRPDEPELLRTAYRIARERDDHELLRQAAEGLLRGELDAREATATRIELSRALARVGPRELALERAEQAATEAPRGSDLHVEAAEHWLSLLAEAPMLATEAGLEMEARARAALRQARGHTSSTNELRAEVELLAGRLGRLDSALELAELALRRAPADGDRLALLTELCGRDEAGERLLISLRRVVEALDESSERDALATILARHARDRDAARTVLSSLEHMSREAATSPEMLDLRDWAVRATGKVDEELEELQVRLVGPSPDPVDVDRLLRALERDPGATAERLMELRAGAAEDSTRSWLAEQAFSVLHRHHPGATEALASVLSTQLADGVLDGPSLAARWREARKGVDPQRDAGVDALLELAASAGRRGIPAPLAEARALAVEALRHRPDRTELHRWFLEAGGLEGGPDAVLDFITEPALPGAEPVGPSLELLEGMAGALAPEAGAALLERRAMRAVPSDLELARGVVDRLRRRGALDAAARLLDAIAREGDVEPAVWLGLAEQARAAGDESTERSTLARAADRLVEEERFHEAVEPLGRLAALDPGDRVHAIALAGCLESTGRPREAVEVLLPWLERPAPERPHLALRAAALAGRAGEPAMARALTARARDLAAGAEDPTLRELHAHATLRLFELAAEDGDLEGARAVALGEAERLAEARPGEAVGWLERAAAIDDTPAGKAELLERALALRPGDEELAARTEAAIVVLGDDRRLATHLRVRILRALELHVDDETTLDQLERLRELVPLDDSESRAWVLDALLRVRPEDPEALMEAAHLRESGDDLEGARVLWRRLETLLPADDPRFFGPAVALAAAATRDGDLQGSVRYLRRARALQPADAGVLDDLLEVAVELEDSALTLEAARQLLELAPERRPRTELLALQAGAHQRSGRPGEALDHFAAAFEAADVPGEQLALLARRWIALATDPGLPEPLLPAAIEHERRARAALRAALSDALPLADLRAEANLLATRSEQPDLGIALLARAVEARPRDLERREALEELCLLLEQPSRYLRELEQIVEHLEGEPAAALGEHLALAARSQRDAELTLRQLERLPPQRQRAPRLEEAREWAVRVLGQAEAEIERLEGSLRDLDAGVPDLEAQVLSVTGRVLRLLDGDIDAWAARVHRLAEHLDARAASTSLMRVLEVVLAERPGDLQLGLESLARAREFAPPELLVQPWTSLARHVLARADTEDMFELLDVAVDLELTVPDFEAVTELAARILGRVPDHEATHRSLYRRAETQSREAELIGELDELAARLELGGEALAGFFAAAGDVMPRAAAETLLVREALSHADDPAVWDGLIEALWRRRCWSALADLLLDPRPGQHLDAGRRVAQLLELAAQAADADDETIQLRALVGAGELAARAGIHERAVEALTRATALAPERIELQARLGHCLAATDRVDAALERILPLLDPPWPDADQLGGPPADLAALAVALLDRLGEGARALELLEQLVEHEGIRGPAQLARAAELRERLSRLGHPHRARALAERILELVDGPARARWLLHATVGADAELQLERLREAHELAPDDDEVSEALVSALEAAGDPAGAIELLRATLQARRASGDDGVERLAVRLLELLGDEEARAAEREELLGLLSSRRPDDPAVLVGLAPLRARQGREADAVAIWRRLETLLARDDDRFFRPALELASRSSAQGDLEGARALLARALEIRPGDAEALHAQLAVAIGLDEPALWLRSAQALLAHDAEQPRAELEAACARAYLRIGDIEAAHASFERACSLAVTGSEQHREYAREWLAAVRDPRATLPDETRREFEARGRAELRAALGDEIDAEALRAEALLLAAHLGRIEEALELIERGLGRSPTDELLLSAYKDLAVSIGSLDRFVAALERALEVAAGDVRDRLATELAYLAVDLEDAPRLLAALERVSPDRASSPELLDLREWAVRKLGRVDEELLALDNSLRTSAHPERALQRLIRMLDGDLGELVARLTRIAGEVSEARAARLFGTALLVASDAHPSEARGVIEILEGAMVQVERGMDPSALLERWPRLELAVVESGDTELLARLAEIALAGVDAGIEGLRSRADDLLGLMLLREPDAPSLHQLLLDRARTSAGDADPLPLAVERLLGLARRLHVRGYTAARMWSGLAALLERSEAADLLGERAKAALQDDPEAFGGLIEALEDRSHWPDVIELLEARIASAPRPEVRVDALKHLAHIRADILGDAGAAIRHLEEALEHAPEDPDLLLPLLDHHYAQRDLGPAVELSVRVLEHVPMGDAAYTALGHRAADAALARGDHAMAEKLLQRVLDRCADDTRTADRLHELRRIAEDPEHRVRMLGAIAARQKGASRIDALEERARLLIDPLRRTDEAIADLESVLDESMERAGSIRRLDELYVLRERWADLVALLERVFPRQAGLDRARTLLRIASLHQDRLFDLNEAEQALRTAREALGSSEAELDLTDEIDLRLARCLELQGRYGEVASHLEAALATELSEEAGTVPPRPGRVALLEELARVLRDYVEDEARAARTYERLEQLGRLPEEGLATLARWYRAQQRHEDLVRVLQFRAAALAQSGDHERKAELDRRIGELLEGPLRRPREAAHHFLDAYLADPEEHRGAGARARVLLAGTDSVVNVRRLLLERLEGLPRVPRAHGLCLLGDLLAPQEDFEDEAERRYRESLQLVRELGAAQEGLGRLLARQGRLADAAEPLVAAAHNPGLEPERAAEAAATAARALLILSRADEAEAVLREALRRQPDAQRALLELARLYHRVGRRGDEAEVLERLSELPLSSLLGAEVAFRKAMLLEDEFRDDPFSQAGELARAHLLEAVGADAMHAQARQVLLDLATRRSEWSIVAHMHFLAIRELQPGTQRALTHLDLAQTYLQRLHDEESALRNLLSALTQPGNDVVVRQRAFVLGERLGDPGRAATAAEKLSREQGDLDEVARARLALLAADLFARADDPEAAERAAQRALDLEGADARDQEAARANLAALGDEAFELKKERSNLRRQLEARPASSEALELLLRLLKVARALDDDELVAESERRLVETARQLLVDPAHVERAAGVLREHFSSRGEFDHLVRLYEQLAASASGPQRRAELLTEAAQWAWSGTRDTKLGLAILRRALGEVPNLPSAITLLGDIADAQEDPELDAMICDEIGSLPPAQIDTQLAVRLSEAARRIGRDEQAQRVLREVLSRQLDPAHRMEALAAMDELLRQDGRQRERLALLGERLGLARAHEPDAAVEIALELARAQRDVGALTEARATIEAQLRGYPDHEHLLAMHAELLAQAEDWPSLAAALESLALARRDPAARADALAEAAKVIMAHGDVTERRDRARGLLMEARAADPGHAQARALLLPLCFGERRWEQVLELSVELRSEVGDDEEVLMLGALTEALVHGRRTIARGIGPRHGFDARQRVLWPALGQLCEVVAQDGPLPRLDAVLGAAASLVGDAQQLLDGLRSWTAAHPLAAGTTVALARLEEALGHNELSRHHYQLAAFLAPSGPIGLIAERLPEPSLPADPLHADGFSPLAWRGTLREVLIQLRDYLAGIRGRGGEAIPVQTADDRELLQGVGRLAARWRERLGVTVPISLTRDPLHAGIGIRNRPEPQIVVSAPLARQPAAERSFRVAMSMGAIATGLAIVTDTHPLPLLDLLDALAEIADPGHVPSSPGARHVADALAARGLRAAQVPAEIRADLARELDHWLRQPQGLDQLVITIRRATMLLATRLSGRLDGALIALARDQALVGGDGRPDVHAVLASPDAAWLLRTLGLHGG